MPWLSPLMLLMHNVMHGHPSRQEKRQVAPRGGSPPHNNPQVVLTTHLGLARKSWVVLTTHPRKSPVVNGKILQLERRDMRMRARMCPAFSAIHQRAAARRPERPRQTHGCTDF